MNKRFAFGFTIAELLITMLITAIVAAAMVPVIGLKKVKFPRNRYNHGIAECYWRPTGPVDSNGDYDDWQLTYYYADSGDSENAGPISLNGTDHCTFAVPQAEYFEIIAIGAGTDAGQGAPTIEMGPQKVLQDGYIRVNSYFQFDIANAKAHDQDNNVQHLDLQLINLLNKWHQEKPNELYANYWVESPVGRGGSGDCMSFTMFGNNASCDKYVTGGSDDVYNTAPLGEYVFSEAIKTYLSHYSSSDHCFAYLSAAGQDSGEGMRSGTITFQLAGNSSLAHYENDSYAGIESKHGVAGQHSLKLYSSGHGADAVVDDNAKLYFAPPSPANGENAHCEGDLCSTVGAVLDNRRGMASTTGSHAGKYCNSLPGAPMLPGKVYYDTYPGKNTNAKRLHWDFIGIDAHPEIPTKGERGSEKSVVYENLKGTLYMYPARYRYQSAGDESYVLGSLNDNSSRLVTAKGGQNFGFPKHDQEVWFAITESAMLFPEKLLKFTIADNANQFTYLDKLRASKFDKGLAACNRGDNRSKPWCPGFAGNGAYFYLNEIPEGNALYVTNLYNPNLRYSIPFQDGLRRKNQEDNNLCLDGLTHPTPMPPQQYIKIGGNEYGTFRPQYCREPKAKGSPGAIIIIW